MKTRHLAGLLISLVLVIVIIGLVGRHSPHRVLAEQTEILPPTAPLVIKATADNLGVTIYWQAAQNGSFPLHTYQIFRKNAAGQFDQIGEVSSEITQYLDVGGQEGDIYKLAGLDDQQPADISQYSDETIAVSPAATPFATMQPVISKPAESSTTQPTDVTPMVNTPSVNQPSAVTPSAPAPAPSTTVQSSQSPTTLDQLPGPQVSSDFRPADLPPSVKPDQVAVNSIKDLAKSSITLSIDTSHGLDTQKAEQIQKVADLKVAQLQTAIAQSKDDLIKPVLSQYTYGMRLLYQNFNTLPPPQKTATAQACGQQYKGLETSFLSLTEQYQMDLLVALAQCHLINGQQL